MKKENFEEIQTSLLMPVGKRINRYRKLRKISRNKLGQGVGVKLLQIQQYETGKVDIPISRIYLISKTLQIPCAELLPEQLEVSSLSNDLLELFSYIEQHEIDSKKILNYLKEGKIK